MIINKYPLIPVFQKEQRLSSTCSSGCRTPCEDEQDHRSDLVQDSVAQTLERDCKDTPTNNQLRPAHSCSEEAGSDSAPSDLSEKQLIAVSPQVSTIRKVKTDTSQYLNKLRNRNCRSNRPLVSADPSMYCIYVASIYYWHAQGLIHD